MLVEEFPEKKILESPLVLARKLKKASSFLPLHKIFNKFLVFPHQVICLLEDLAWMGLCVLEVDTVSCSPYRPRSHRLKLLPR